jgi:hypothetical protein
LLNDCVLQRRLVILKLMNEKLNKFIAVNDSTENKVITRHNETTTTRATIF